MTRQHDRLMAGTLVVALGLAGAACGDDDDAGLPADDQAAAPGLDGTVTVFAAASLTDALAEVADAFEEANPDVTVELNFAGSSALREQILAGAPADVLASANPSSMQRVVDAGEVEGEVRTFAHNSLEIAVPAGNPGEVEGLGDFADEERLIGLCAPEVPCGDLGREALANARVTAAPDTEEPDVRSLLTKIEAGELDAGIVYRSDVLAAGGAVDGIAIPDEVNVVADYPVGALARAGEPELADAFVELLLSDDGQTILESHGFTRA